MNAETSTTYRLAPPDAAGALFGLTVSQCVVLAGGLFAATVLVELRTPPATPVVPILVAIAMAFIRVGGQLATSHAITALAYRLRRVRPDRVVFDEIATVCGSVGIVCDRRHRRVTATVTVTHDATMLRDDGEQHHRIGLWGDVLASSCLQRAPIAAITWSQWPTPPCFDPPRTVGRVPADYQHLLDLAKTRTVTTERVVSITLRTSRAGLDRHEVAEQLRLLVTRLRTAGVAARPLTADELRDAVAVRLTGAHPTNPPGNLRDAVTRRVPHTTISERWDHASSLGRVHAMFAIDGWPHGELTAGWFEPFATGDDMAVVVQYLPVPPGRSRRQIDRDAVRLVSDETQRHRAGFRVGARHTRDRALLEQRDAELAGGHRELRYGGLIAVSAPDQTSLAERCADVSQHAAMTGLTLRRLNGRHHHALAAMLPLGMAMINEERL